MESFKQWLAGPGAEDLVNLRFQFGAPLSLAACLLLLLALGLGVGWFYRRRTASLPKNTRRFLMCARVAVMLLAGFLLLDPGFVGFRFDPTEQFVLLLFDDSKSMRIPLATGETRGERLKRAIEENRESMMEPLRASYQVALYKYGEGAERISSLDSLEFGQDESNHGLAVESALRDFQGIEIAAVVLFTDGVEQPGASADVVAKAAEWNAPLLTVGVGKRDSWSDLQLENLAFSRSRGGDRPVSTSVAFSATALAGRRVRVEVADGRRVMDSKTVTINGAEESHEVHLEFRPDRKGWLAYTARIGLEAGPAEGAASEPVLGNNESSFLLDNREKTWRIFYFCGRPNWENKFVQRALREDKEFDLTSVLRISAAETKFVYRGKKSTLVNPLFEGFDQEDKDQPRYDEAVFLRFGGKQEDAGRGFPEKAEDLFGYDLLIMGDIEAGFFSLEQLELVRDFVRKRGGVLFMLGGPHSFSEGDYGASLLETLLPVVLEKKKDPEARVTAFSQSFKAKPSVDGLLSGYWSLAANPVENDRMWANLPDLAGLNTFPLTRPGATIMATSDSPDSAVDGLPLFALQRYGEGITAVLATGATWAWHMHTESEDPRHGDLWRRMARGLAREAAPKLWWRNKQDAYVEREEVVLEIMAQDDRFDEWTGLQARLSLTPPRGAERNLALEESLTEPGLYQAVVHTGDAGLYRWRLSGVGDAAPSVLVDEAFLVEPDQREWNHARFNEKFPRDLAAATGGAYFSLDRLGELIDRIPRTSHRESDRVRLPFWHFWLFFPIFILLLSLEWYLRRKKGFA